MLRGKKFWRNQQLKCRNWAWERLSESPNMRRPVRVERTSVSARRVLKGDSFAVDAHCWCLLRGESRPALVQAVPSAWHIVPRHYSFVKIKVKRHPLCGTILKQNLLLSLLASSSPVPLVAQNTRPVSRLDQVTSHFMGYFLQTLLGRSFQRHPEVPLVATFCISLTPSPGPFKSNANQLIKG